MRMMLTICGIALMLSCAAGAETLGRLFYTPAQRAQMDFQFAQEVQPGGNGSSLTLNGIVQMQGGRRTTWINGVAQPAGPGDDRSPASQHVRLPGQNRTVRLKVGQRVLLDTSSGPDAADAGTARPDTSKPFSSAAPAPGNP